MDIVGKRIADLLDRRGMTQKALALKVGVSQATVSKWCAGKGSIDAYNLKLVCDALNISADYLLSRTASVRPDQDPQRWTTDYTGLSDAAISMLHKLVTTDSEKSQARIDALNLLIESRKLLRLIDAMSDFYSVSAFLSGDYQNAIVPLLDHLFEEVGKKDDLISIAYEYYEGGFFITQEEADKDMKRQLRKRERERKIALFSITDTSSEIVKANFEKNSQYFVGLQKRAFLHGLLKWFDYYIGREYEDYTIYLFKDKPEAIPLPYEDFLKNKYPSFGKLEKGIKKELKNLQIKKPSTC